jgi:hypothetical protein
VTGISPTSAHEYSGAINELCTIDSDSASIWKN